MKKKMMRKKWESNKKLTKAIHSHENQDLHVDEEIEIQAEGESYRKTSPLRKLRAGLKMCGLGRGKNKQEAWAKLVHYYIHFAENLSTELARKDSKRAKLMKEKVLEVRLSPGSQASLRGRRMS